MQNAPDGVNREQTVSYQQFELDLLLIALLAARAADKAFNSVFESRIEAMIEYIGSTMDAGPLGYNTICAHGHADALAFTLSLGGREVLVDPGTYSYRPDSPWRAYFRSTAAHNTLRLDGMDQSEPGGNFLWLRKAKAGCTLWKISPEHDVFEGWHDGYARLADPVLHRRRITLDKAARRIVVEDRLEMRGTHNVELYFHCSERCSVDPLPYGFVIRHAATEVELRLPLVDGARSGVRRGSLSPICGWISRRFDEKLPSPTIVWHARLTGPAVLSSELYC